MNIDDISKLASAIFSSAQDSSLLIEQSLNESQSQLTEEIVSRIAVGQKSIEIPDAVAKPVLLYRTTLRVLETIKLCAAQLIELTTVVEAPAEPPAPVSKTLWRGIKKKSSRTMTVKPVSKVAYAQSVLLSRLYGAPTGGWLHFKHEQLSTELDCSKQTISNALNALKERKLARKRGRALRAEYQLTARGLKYAAEHEL